jgi:hypothetical protein
MSHPLDNPHAWPIGKRWAAMQALRKGDDFHLRSGSDALVVLKDDTMIALLPERFTVFDPNGEPVLPSPGKRFAITTRTIDPIHCIAEVE